MANRPLTIALDKYDRHMPFFMGTLALPDGIALESFNVGMAPPARDGLRRHARMFHEKEFDIAEVSLSSYILAKARGEISDITAIPVFPRRLFSQNQMFVNVDAGIESPADLAGKKVGVWSFQTTLSVLAKGDLKFHHGVAWEGIRWFAQYEEEFDVTFAQGVEVNRLAPSQNVGDMLVAGELDAVFMPHPPPVILTGSDRVRRLFADPRAECQRYFEEHGCYPIMHLLAIHKDLADSRPDLPMQILDIWEDAKRQAEEFNHDPAFSHAIFAHQDIEAQRVEMTEDVWPSGLSVNRKNLERFVMYLADQGLIEQEIAIDPLFHETTLQS